MDKDIRLALLFLGSLTRGTLTPFLPLKSVGEEPASPVPAPTPAPAARKLFVHEPRGWWKQRQPRTIE